METYASQMSSKSLAVRFVEDCAEVLVKYKADVCKVGGFVWGSSASAS